MARSPAPGTRPAGPGPSSATRASCWWARRSSSAGTGSGLTPRPPRVQVITLIMSHPQGVQLPSVPWDHCITRCQKNRCHNNLGALISESRRSSLRRKWAPRNLTFLVFRECEIDCVKFLFGLSTMHIFLCNNCHYHHVGHRQTTVLSKLSSTHSMWARDTKSKICIIYLTSSSSYQRSDWTSLCFSDYDQMIKIKQALL